MFCRFFSWQLSLLLGMLFLLFCFFVCSLDLLGVDDQTHHLVDVCMRLKNPSPDHSFNSSLTSCVRSSAQGASAASASLLPSCSLHACALLCETSTPRPQSSLTTYVFVAKNFRMRSVRPESRAHIVARVMTPATTALTSSSSSSASRRALPLVFLVVANRHCFLAWGWMVSRRPRHVSFVLKDKPEKLVEPSLRFGFFPRLQLTRVRGTRAALSHGHRSALCKGFAVSSCPLVVAVAALLVPC